MAALAISIAHGRAIIAQWLSHFASLDFTSSRALYIYRCLLAAAFALVCAYQLELEMPYSAASTVLLVINPTQGAVLGKGNWRFLGTLIGMLAAFVLMAFFVQKPWLFILGFASWLGVCVVGMSLLRHFRATGSVVAGYTVGLALYGAMQHPELTFEHVIGRGSTVFIGVLCLSIVTALLSKRISHKKLLKQIQQLPLQVASHLAKAEPDAEHSQQLIAQLYRIDDLLAVAKEESAEVALRAYQIRQALQLLASCLMKYNHSAELTQFWQAVAQNLAENMPQVETFRAQLITLGASPIAQQRFGDFVLALMDLAMADQQRKKRHKTHFYRNWSFALTNGLRAGVTLFLAGAFWLITGWDQGDMMLLVLAPYCSLLATAGNPLAGASAFIRGTLYAIPAAFICSFLIFPEIEGLPLLLLVLMAFWLPGIYATSEPKSVMTGLAYLVGFNTLAAAENPMHYDFVLFLNWSLAWVLATVFVWLGFALLWPRNVAKDQLHIYQHLTQHCARIFIHGVLDNDKWLRQQQHKLVQLAATVYGQPSFLLTQLGWLASHIQQQLAGQTLSAVQCSKCQQLLSFIGRRLAEPEKAQALAKRLEQQVKQQLHDPLLSSDLSTLRWLLEQLALVRRS